MIKLLIKKKEKEIIIYFTSRTEHRKKNSCHSLVKINKMIFCYAFVSCIFNFIPINNLNLNLHNNKLGGQMDMDMDYTC